MADERSREPGPGRPAAPTIAAPIGQPGAPPPDAPTGKDLPTRKEPAGRAAETVVAPLASKGTPDDGAAPAAAAPTIPALRGGDEPAAPGTEVDDVLAGSEIFGDFRPGRRLGEGGMGVVYSAHQISLDRPVALKILYPHVARQPGFVERFRREAQISAKLRHLSIVQGYAVGEERGLHYFAMEFVDGTSVEALLAERGPFSVGDAVKIAADVARALVEAERHNLVHRDIKPANIMITRDGVVKLADFGLAKAAGDARRLTQVGTVFGTPGYMAPEQVDNPAGADGRADIYSLGATLYNLLTARDPFAGNSLLGVLRAQEKDQREPAGQLNPDVPADLDRVIDTMLAADPEERFQSAGDVVAGLDATGLANPHLSWIPAPSGAVEAPPARSGFLPGAAPGWKRRAAAAAALLLAVGAAVIATRWYGGRPEPAVPPPIAAPPALDPVAERTLRHALSEISSGSVPSARAILADAAARYPELAPPLQALREGALVLFQYRTESPIDAQPVTSMEPIWYVDGVARLKTDRDSFRFAVALARPCYVYAFQIDPRRQVTQLFPNPATSPASNPLPGDRVFWLPDAVPSAAESERCRRGDCWWYLDDAVGTEAFVFVGVSRPLRDPEALKGELLKPFNEVRARFGRELASLVQPGDVTPTGCFPDGAVERLTFRHE